jgi:exoribonuclease R
MKPWRIYIDDRNYASWKYYGVDSKDAIHMDLLFNPYEKKLFNNDIIYETGDLVHSYIRECPSLAGILLLENNKTFGRTENKKRLLYKCIPDDKRLPAFLIPYDIKLGFSKNIQNKYVVFRFENWDDIFPRGTLIEVLGDVTKMEAFYEYKLFCRNLNESNKEFIKKTHYIFKQDKTEECIQKILNNPNFIIENRTHEYVFTIDPKNSLDFDDAFSIVQTATGWKVSVYIANVFFWMEEFGLWESFHKRVSTIYLPDRRRPMLPTILSDNLCSLLENHLRFAFCMDVEFDNNNFQKYRVTFSNVLIKVSKNFVYEESSMIKNKQYRELMSLSQRLDSTIEDSHDIVAQWMVFMNKECAVKLMERKTGIFRIVCSKTQINDKRVVELYSGENKDTEQFIKHWNSIYGQYVLFSEETNLQHDLLNVKSYTHITSPIRRLTDLLNQIIFFKEFGLINQLSDQGDQFLKKWLTDMENINERMRSVMKVERDCEIVRKCLTNVRMLDVIHEAIVLNIKEQEIDGRIIYKYLLYLEKEKIVLPTKSEQKKGLYQQVRIKLYKIESYGVSCKIKVGWHE